MTGRSYEDEDYPRMDSISLVLRHKQVKEVQTITNTIIERQKARKWHISVNAGYAYGIINRKPDLYVGIGVSYDIW